MMKNLNYDKFRGVYFGQAVGDALGLGTEGMKKDVVRSRYRRGLRNYSQIIQDAHRKRWKKGDWTDDTEQMTAIADSLIKNGVVDVRDIARNFYDWAKQGGMGIGITTTEVLYHPEFLGNPHKAAEYCWEQSNRYAAANGALMRTSVLGAWDIYNEQKMLENTETVCKITHYDPRCIASCIAMTTMIRHLVLEDLEVDEILEKANATARKYDERIEDFFELAIAGRIDDLQLDEEGKVGYTYKTLASGIWALKYSGSFFEGLHVIIHEGGDADTNGAVAGALLGAKFGYNDIPKKLITGLSWRKYMDRIVDKIYERESSQ